MKSLILLLLPILTSAAPPDSPVAPIKKNVRSSGEFVTSSVGEVGDTIVTARQVLISSIAEDVLYRKRFGGLSLARINDRAFSRETSAILLEYAIWIESKGFPVASVSAAEIKAKAKEMLAETKKSPYQSSWSSIQASRDEIDHALQRKLAAKKMIKFKADTASLPVTDDEAQAYFQKNKFKYENLPYENFRESIKQFLTQKQSEERLQEWFEVLRVKYKIHNQLAGRL